jgi:hypothetical protein
MKSLLKTILVPFGINLRRYDPTHDLGELLRLYSVETIFDIGANAGVSGRYFRNLGFKGSIVSFEPVASPVSQNSQLTAQQFGRKVPPL